MKQLLIGLLGGGFLAGIAFADDALLGDPVEGEKVSRQCRTCHGRDGYAVIPIAPHIAGEPETYLADQLRAFRDGSREHEMMTVVAKGLSDQQILDVAAWYADHKVMADASVDLAEAPTTCVACHGADGIAVLPTAPHLAGETNIYIETQLKAFRSGRRESELMSDIAADLTDEKIRELANWFAAIKLTVTRD